MCLLGDLRFAQLNGAHLNGVDINICVHPYFDSIFLLQINRNILLTYLCRSIYVNGRKG